MKKRELEKLGIPRGPAMDAALDAVIAAAHARMDNSEIVCRVQSLVSHPASLRGDPLFGAAARLLDREQTTRSQAVPKRARCRVWGTDIDAQAIAQIDAACSLPVAIRGALMPDAHVGYGLPIGGVLAVRKSPGGAHRIGRVAFGGRDRRVPRGV